LELSEKGFTFVISIKNKQKMENKQALNLINLFNAKGNRHGYWEDYWSNGNLMHKGNYVDGKENGYWESYWSNGNLDYKGNYVDGKEHGYWEEYWSNGNLDYKGFYDMGNKVDYNPDEPKVTELTLDEIASKFGINVNQLKIKK
jgi:antitoxin component YwqK of YwqJK toxin-antitoxin module